MIHVGDGKHVEVEEGALNPPPPRTGPKHPNRRKSPPLSKGLREFPARAYAATPGWRDWKARIRLDITLVAPPSKFGRPKGHADGYRKPELEALRGEILNILMQDEDLNALLASINEDDPIAAFAMREMIKLAALPGGTRDRVSLLKIILEFTKSKPATKTEMKVAQQDAWAMLIAEETTPTVPALPNADK